MRKGILKAMVGSLIAVTFTACGSGGDETSAPRDVIGMIKDASKQAQEFKTDIPSDITDIASDIVSGSASDGDTTQVKSLTVQDRYLGKYMPYLDGSRSDKLIKVFKFPNDFENDDMSFVEILYVSNDGVENITSDGYGELNSTNLKVNYLLSSSDVAADYVTFKITQGEDGEYLSIGDETWDNSMVFDSIADIYSHIDYVRTKLITIGG